MFNQKNQSMFIFPSHEEEDRFLRSKQQLAPCSLRTRRFTTFSFFFFSLVFPTLHSSGFKSPKTQRHWMTAVSVVIASCCDWLRSTSVSGVHVCTFTPPAGSQLGGNRYFPSGRGAPSPDKSCGTYTAAGG